VTVRTPNFIIDECERLIEALPHEHRHKAEKVLEQLQNYNSEENIILILDHMIELESKHVNPCMNPRLFRRSLISLSLIKALNLYENKEEAKMMLNKVQQMARFESSWCQDDELYKWDRTFNVVTSPTEWKRVCARAKVLPNSGSIQIALQIKKPKKLKIAQKVWQELSCNKKINNKPVKEYYEIWFRQTERACYYIYLP